MNNLFAALMIVLFSINLVLADSRSQSYYDSIEPHYFDQDLKNALFKIVQKNHRSLDYREARVHLFGSIHLERDNSGYFIEDVYCEKTFDSFDGVGRNQIPDHNKLNCEHTWPQSRFSSNFPKELQKGDLHHLYPTDSRANSTRGNYPFADVNGRSLENGCSASKIGSPARQKSSRYFEPPTKHKGNVARALFYFSVRYQIRISSTQEIFLKKWHVEDPVDEAERERNEAVFAVQNNRNPFIDKPELVSQISDF